MQNELPEKINSLLNDLNSNSAPKILNAMEKLEKYGVPDYRVIYAIREYSVSAVSPFFHYKATRLADKLEALASRFLNRPISQLTDRELMEKIVLEQLAQKRLLKEIFAFLLVIALTLISIQIRFNSM